MNHVLRRNKKDVIQKIIYNLLLIMVFVAMLLSCNSADVITNDEMITPPNPSNGSIAGTVKDENGNPYPETRVRLTKDAKTILARTKADGSFNFENIDLGIHEITIDAPLSTKTVTEIPFSIDIQASSSASVDIIIQPQALVADLVIGSSDIFGEIRSQSGNIPIEATEPLYARNVWDAPLGLLTEIKTPDLHHLTLSEWEDAQGTVIVTCNGNTSSASITLQGMIPEGTYTFWLNFLNKVKQVGQQINFETDVATIAPLGSGTINVVAADTDGIIQTEIVHPSCILTNSAALVLVVVYHINGNTYGSSHIPDPEEVSQMLVYFQ